jgi:hypothetical protein
MGITTQKEEIMAKLKDKKNINGRRWEKRRQRYRICEERKEDENKAVEDMSK